MERPLHSSALERATKTAILYSIDSVLLLRMPTGLADLCVLRNQFPSCLLLLNSYGNYVQDVRADNRQQAHSLYFFHQQLALMLRLPVGKYLRFEAVTSIR